ncbi:MAG: NHL domain-containing protein [Dehalococcoidia bacterium]
MPVAVPATVSSPQPTLTAAEVPATIQPARALTATGSSTDDVNGDGQVTPLDAQCVLRDLAALPPTAACPAPYVHQHADVSGAGTISPVDAQCVLRAIASLPATPACPPPISTPPDPTGLAPALTPGSGTSVCQSAQFLYSGGNPIQTGVSAGVIQCQRTTVLRGRVLSRINNPLPGVTVSVLGHPEFGQTISRSDGMFDLAVNGGGQLTVTYTRFSLLPAQRQVQAPWQDFALLPDVILLPLDPRVTPIDLTASTPIQVARGSVQTDSDGTRQATVLFPQGTQAMLVLPDGTTQSVTTLHVRATEYTSGANGPQAMPGALPPTSQYTYAVELSADEAIAAGATTVQFSQPVWTYLENFLNFPVGQAVPLGTYDRTQGMWIPGHNGIILKLLSVTAGLADLDIDGSGHAASAAALAAIGITDAERQTLATLYAVGQSLLRLPTPHFSGEDANWAGGQGPSPQLRPRRDGKLPNPCDPAGPTIECENQILGEDVPIVGTEFALHYRSDHAPGRTADLSLTIPLSGDPGSFPGGVQGIELAVQVAGQLFDQKFPAQANLTYTFTWDGKDAYGRPVQGPQPVTVRIGYTYQTTYQQALVQDWAFGLSNGIPLGGNPLRHFITIWQEQHASLGSWLEDGRGTGLGGWTIDAHHAYDAAGHTIYFGDGSRQSLESLGLNNTLTTIAGSGQNGNSGDGGPATQATLSTPRGLVAAPDGSLYLTSGRSVRRIAPDGTISTVAGNGQDCTVLPPGCGDGGPATQAQLSFAGAARLAYGPDGSLYIVDDFVHRVRRVAPNGTISTVAGTGVGGFSGDGGPATQAQLNHPRALAVGPDGSLYIADSGNQRLRKVAPGGIISTVAGTGTAGFSGDGGPAMQAQLNQPDVVAAGRDGTLFIGDSLNLRIRRVGVDGLIATVAGTGLPCSNPLAAAAACGDGGLATAAQLGAGTVLGEGNGLAVDQNGGLYIADGGDNRIRLVGADGIITTVAGTGAGCGGTPQQCGEKVPATQAALCCPADVALGPEGNLYTVDAVLNRVRRIAPALPGIGAAGSLTVPSADGSELYQFTSDGRHQQTLSTLTGAVRYTFGYAAGGRLSTLTDGYGNVTTIQHDAQGNPTAIVAPFGQRTALAVDANGYLSQITDPVGASVALTTAANGLLTAYTDARNNTSTFTYDGVGRLTRATNPVGGFTMLSRIDSPTGYTVTKTNALNDSTTYAVTTDASGNQVRIVTAPNGAVTSLVTHSDGSSQATDARGVVTATILGADPRFGMVAAFVASETMTGSDHLAFSTVTASRTAQLSNPADPLSLISQTDIVTQNGRTTVSLYTVTGRTLTVTDPAGAQTTSTLDMLGQPLSVQKTSLAPVQYSYDGHGRVTAVTEGSGGSARTTTNTYNSDGLLAAVTDPLAGVTSFTYDHAGRKLTQTIPTGQVLSFTADAGGNLSSSTNAQGVLTTYEYDARNRLTAETLDPGGRAVRTEYLYDLADNLISGKRDAGTGRLNLLTQFTYTSIGNDGYAVSRVTNPLGQQTSFTYTPYGAVASVTDPLGHITTTAYTPQGWPATVTTPAGRISSTTYNNDGQPVRAVDPRGVTATYTYDAAARLHSVNAGAAVVAGSPALNETTTYAYDALSRLISVTDARGKVGTRGYDAFNRLVSQSDPTGDTATFAYDPLDRVTLRTVGANVSAQAQQTAYTYDAAGRLLTEQADPTGLQLTTRYRYTRQGSTDTWNLQQLVDPRGNTTSYRVNTLGVRDQVIDALNQTWSYSFDNLARTIGRTDPLNRTTSYTVDALGRRTALTEADGAEHWSYNADGTLGSYTDLGGHVTAYTYDADARTTGISYATGTAPAAFSYDASSNVVSMTDGLGATSYTYDAANRMLTRARDLRTVTYSYNATDQVTNLDYWGKGGVGYGYDDSARLTSLTPWGGPATTFSYRGTGQLNAETRANGVTTSFSYDSASRLLGLSHRTGGPTPTTLLQIGYTLDANGNRTQLSDGDGVTSYAYDALDRLTNVVYPAIPGGPGASTVPYTYDATGNRLSDGTSTFTYDSSDRSTGAGFSYDSSGNLTSDGTTTYAYDGANRLISTTKGGVTTSYGYDGWGNLIRETVNGVTSDLVLDENAGLPRVLGEVRSDGTETDYAYGAEGVSAQRQVVGGSGQPAQYPLLDGLGSLRQLTDPGATVILNRSYDAFGNLRQSIGAGRTTLGYTGERTGTVDGLVYLRARFYQPTQGRFVQRDSFQGSAATPQSLDRYSYVRNDPTTRVDPAGHDDSTTRSSLGLVMDNGIANDRVDSIYNVAPEVATQIRAKQAEDAYWAAYVDAHPEEVAQLNARLAEDDARRADLARQQELENGPELISREELDRRITAAAREALPGLTIDTALLFAGAYGASTSSGSSPAPFANPRRYFPPANRTSKCPATAPEYPEFQRLIEENQARAASLPASTPVGRPGSKTPNIVGMNVTSTVNGRLYGPHALDRMQGRGFVPSVVEDTIARGRISWSVDEHGRPAVVYQTEQLKVVVNPSRMVVSVMKPGE